MEPIWQLLRTKTKKVGWSAAHKDCLRSIIPNRQYPQTRVKSCGWSTHDRSLFCLSDLVDSEAQGDSTTQQQQQQEDRQTHQQGDDPGSSASPPLQQLQAKSRTFEDVVEATPDQIARAPKGDLLHRHWKCLRTDALRKQHAREADIRAANLRERGGHPTWGRALTVRPSMPLRTKSKV